MTTETKQDGVVRMLCKVPEITLYFWIIKILATTVGETAADYLNTNLKLGLTGTSVLMSGFLAVALFFQFRFRRYEPAVYWIAVVLCVTSKTLHAGLGDGLAHETSTL